MNHLLARATGKWSTPLAGLFILLLLFGFSFFHALGGLPLMDPDESRYAEIPREMLELGDFVTPHLNYVMYIEKPPLYYWLTAASLKLFGETEFAARFFSALSGLASVVIVWYVGLRVFGRREGMFAGLILGTSIGYLVQARLNIIDVFLTCLMTGAMGSFLLASRPDEPRKGRYYHLFYVFSALAVLAKGLIGILLPGAVIFLYMALARRWRLVREMRIPTGAPLFILIAAPWFIIVTIRNPIFPGFFFIHEHLLRFFTTEHGRYQACWFFVPILAGCMFPWSCFLPAAIAGALREWKLRRDDSVLFIAIWAGFIFCFFSFSGSKLVPYVLPVFPPTALLIGMAFSKIAGGEFRSIKWEALFLFIVLLGGAVTLLLYPFLAANPKISAMGCAVIGLSLLGEALLVSVCMRRSNAHGLFLSLCLMTYLQGIFGPGFIIPYIQKKRSFKELALAVKERARPEDGVFSFDVYTQDLPFYAQRRIILVGVTNDLKLGSTQGDQSAWFISYPQFYELWDSKGPLFVMIEKSDVHTLQESVTMPIRIIREKEEMLLITNR